VLQLARNDFFEVPTALGDLQVNANAQEQVLMLLSKQGPMNRERTSAGTRREK